MTLKPARNSSTAGACAVVTGAGSGIGRSLCLELARRDAEIVCSDLRMAAAEATAAQCRELGATAHPIQCDVGSLRSVEDLATAAQTCLAKPISLIINNAGIGVGGSRIGDLGIEKWRAAMDVNLWGPIHGCEVFVPLLRAQGGGGIINIASAASFAAAPFMGPYCVSKAGVLSLSELLAAELADTAITVSVVCPTLVKTDIVASADVADGTASMVQRLMDAVGVSADGVARAILDGHEKGRLYIVPQVDAKVLWSAKRHAPRTYFQGMRLMNRLVGGRLTPAADRAPDAPPPQHRLPEEPGNRASVPHPTYLR